MTATPEAPSPAHNLALPPEAYTWMSIVLRAGLFVGLAFLAVFAVLYTTGHSDVSLAQLIASNPILGYLSWDGLTSGLAAGRPEAYLTVGVFILFATPIARVLTGLVFFVRGGDRVLAEVTLVVLALLLVGVFLIGPAIR